MLRQTKHITVSVTVVDKHRTQSTLREEQNSEISYQPFLHSLIVIRPYGKPAGGEKWRHFNIRLWSKRLKKVGRRCSAAHKSM